MVLRVRSADSAPPHPPPYGTGTEWPFDGVRCAARARSGCLRCPSHRCASGGVSYAMPPVITADVALPVLVVLVGGWLALRPEPAPKGAAVCADGASRIPRHWLLCLRRRRFAPTVAGASERATLSGDPELALFDAALRCGVRYEGRREGHHRARRGDQSLRASRPAASTRGDRFRSPPLRLVESPLARSGSCRRTCICSSSLAGRTARQQMTTRSHMRNARSSPVA